MAFLISVYIYYKDTIDVFEFRTITRAGNVKEAIEKGIRKIASAMANYFTPEDYAEVVDLLLLSKVKIGVKKIEEEKETKVEIFRNRGGNMIFRNEVSDETIYKNIANELEKRLIEKIKGIEHEHIEFEKKLIKKIKGIEPLEAVEKPPKKILELTLIQSEIYNDLEEAEEKSTLKKFIRYDREKEEEPILFKILRYAKEGRYSKYEIAQKIQEEGYLTHMKTDTLRRRISALNLEKQGVIYAEYRKEKKVINGKERTVMTRKINLTEKGERFLKMW